jgi:cytochrome c oxidase subunit 1
MLYGLSFMFLFTIGGLTGLFLGTLATDIPLHDTYFVVAHFHYVMMGSTVIAFLGGIHHWWPKMTGKLYNEPLGRVTAGIVFITFNVTFLTQFVLGTKGMPRRYFNYLEEYESLHFISSMGAFGLGIGFLIMLFYLLHSLFWGKPAPDNPWGGVTLEWKTATPPVKQNFAETPVITGHVYDYDEIGELETRAAAGEKTPLYYRMESNTSEASS